MRLNGTTAWEVTLLLLIAVLTIYVLTLERRVRLLENWKKLRQKVQDIQTGEAIHKLATIAEYQQRMMDEALPPRQERR